MEDQISGGFERDASKAVTRSGVRASVGQSGSVMKSGSVDFSITAVSLAGYSGYDILPRLTLAKGAIIGNSWVVGVPVDQAMTNAVAEPQGVDTLDEESLEAARQEIRAGFREGFAPLHQVVLSMEQVMRAVSEATQRLQRSRGTSR